MQRKIALAILVLVSFGSIASESFGQIFKRAFQQSQEATIVAHTSPTCAPCKVWLSIEKHRWEKSGWSVSVVEETESKHPWPWFEVFELDKRYEIVGMPLTHNTFVAAKTVQGPVEVAAVKATTPHVRCIYNGSCGSGTICGADQNGAYVLTNAHVVGTAIGRVATVDVVTASGSVRTTGRIVMAGYSDRTMVDFSILHCEGLTSDRYMKLLKTQPEAQPYKTTGGPKCVWPQVTKAFNDPRNYGDGLITGSPDAIGGQSGSAIYNANGQQIALLTWSISGRCAGQKTSKLWQVATQRNVNLADPRVEGMKEVADDPESLGYYPDGGLALWYADEGFRSQHPNLKAEYEAALAGNRPETECGIFGECSIFETAQEGEPTLAETPEQIAKRKAAVGKLYIGVQNVVGSAMADLPIWYEAEEPPPVDPTDPECHKLTAKEWELIQFLRNQAKETGWQDIDWMDVLMDVLPIVLELLKKIQESK